MWPRKLVWESMVPGGLLVCVYMGLFFIDTLPTFLDSTTPPPVWNPVSAQHSQILLECYMITLNNGRESPNAETSRRSMFSECSNVLHQPYTS